MSMSLFGFCYFAGTFAGYSTLRSFPWFFMGILLFISSHRENLVNIQITGFLALLAALGFKSLEMGAILSRLIGTALIAISIETKPHLLGLFVLVTLIQRKKYNVVGALIVFFLSFQILISIYIGELITKSWLKILFSLGKNSAEGALPERIAFETPFLLIGISPKISTLLMIGFFAVGSALTLVIARKKSTGYLGLVIPSFGIFFHYYDLALAFGLMLTLLYSKKHFKEFFLLIGIYLVPQNFESLLNIALVVIVILSLALSTAWKSWATVLHYVFLGIVSWCSYIFFVKLAVASIDIHELSMSLSILLSLTMALWLYRKNRVQLASK
jgi:hypothetical protein